MTSRAAAAAPAECPRTRRCSGRRPSHLARRANDGDGGGCDGGADGAGPIAMVLLAEYMQYVY